MSIVGIRHRGQEIVGQFIKRGVNDSVILSNVRVVETTVTDTGHFEFALSPYTIFDVDGQISFRICADCDLFDNIPTVIETAYTTAITVKPTITEVTVAILQEKTSSLTKRLGLF